MRDRSIVVVLYGPKGAGKSLVAEQLNRLAGVHHVDVDRMVLELSARGRRPDPEQGWLKEVEAEVSCAAGEHPLVSVEATGAWDSDWMLAGHLAAAGCLVLPVWVTTPLEVTLHRLARRRTCKVPVSSQQARWIQAEATRRAATHTFTAVIDTAGTPEPSRLNELLALLR